MGKTIEKVTIQNYNDIYDQSKGRISSSEIRTVEVDALVDTGATYLCVPPEIIKKLGLPLSHSNTVKTANVVVERHIYEGARMTILDRSVQMQVMESDENTPPLIGYLVLEALDFIVNPKTQKLAGNPEHDGKWMVDLYKELV